MKDFNRKVHMALRIAYLSFLCLCMNPAAKGVVIPFAGSRIRMARGSEIQVNEGAKLFINTNCVSRGERKSTIRLDKGARVRALGSFSFFYDADVVVFPGGELTLGSGYINSNCKIRCAKSINIGKEVAISHDVTIMDSDHHSICGQPVAARPVVIGDHVWIGTRSTILKGVTVGEGSIVAAGALVTKDIPPNSLVAGVPAKVIKEGVWWD
ncbi:acyltransferase [Adlercreutzia sp. ZJ141]|uniref:acyltransferase n=1 Tax=Adlercreutzia sp. ZJ141 TaxID=2709406 RepID=UPI00197E77FC|nr:acyltransferase [Adlercreutzia sp. ZJ141]